MTGIIQGVTDSYRKGLLQGTHVFGTDVIKVALYTSAATINQLTTAYTATGEVSGAGYTPGGQALTNVSVQSQSGVAWVQWNTIVFTGLANTIAARGAMFYNASKSNASVMILDFGTDILPSSGVITLAFPPFPSIMAPLRLA